MHESAAWLRRGEHVLASRHGTKDTYFRHGLLEAREFIPPLYADASGKSPRQLWPLRRDRGQSLGAGGRR